MYSKFKTFKGVALGLIFSIVLIISSSSVFAQETASELNFEPEIDGWSVDGAATDQSCFDYYKFQSVQVSVGPEGSVYRPGNVINFSGYIHNQNDYPVIAGNVFVRISRFDDEFALYGHSDVDEIFVAEDLALAAGEQKEIDFGWYVPEGLLAGEYVASYYFTVDKRFNLGGLPFTSDIVSDRNTFTIESDTLGSVSFDHKNVQVNGQKYQSVGLPVSIPNNSTTTVQATLKNSTGQTQNITMEQALYFWDTLRSEDLIQSDNFNIVLAPGESRVITANVEPNEGVMMIRMSAKYNNENYSLLNVRMTTDRDRVRLNYPGVDQFPIAAGETANLFTCFHNINAGSVSGKVSVQAKVGNEVLVESMYTGEISSAMSVIAKAFTAHTDISDLAVYAKVENDEGEVIEELTLNYNCDILKCGFANANANAESEVAGDTSRISWIIIAIIIPLLILGGFLLARKNN